jgi:hypothetical protein
VPVDADTNGDDVDAVDEHEVLPQRGSLVTTFDADHGADRPLLDDAHPEWSKGPHLVLKTEHAMPPGVAAVGHHTDARRRSTDHLAPVDSIDEAGDAAALWIDGQAPAIAFDDRAVAERRRRSDRCRGGADHAIAHRGKIRREGDATATGSGGMRRNGLQRDRPAIRIG